MRDVTCIELIILERVLFPGGSLDAVMIFGPKDNTLDPAHKWTGWYVRKAGIYETLFKYNDEMQLTPELATGYTQVSDTVWDIHLREGVTFHDGNPLDAEAVVYSIGRVMDESNSRSSEYDHIASIVAADAYTVRITTTDPYAPTIASLTDPLVSIVSPDASDLASDPVGTGPFMYDSDVWGASLSVVRNPDYWGGGVKLESVTLTYVSDDTTRAAMLESGDASIARGLPYPQVSTIEGNPDLDVVSKATLHVYNFDKRIVAGRVESGVMREGDKIRILPSGEETLVKTVEEYLNDVYEAEAGKSTGITTEDKLFIDRGDVVVHGDAGDLPVVTDRMRANSILDG